MERHGDQVVGIWLKDVVIKGARRQPKGSPRIDVYRSVADYRNLNVANLKHNLRPHPFWDVVRANIGSTSSARSSRRPARKAKYPAAAIIAALSVHSLSGG